MIPKLPSTAYKGWDPFSYVVLSLRLQSCGQAVNGKIAVVTFKQHLPRNIVRCSSPMSTSDIRTRQSNDYEYMILFKRDPTAIAPRALEGNVQLTNESSTIALRGRCCHGHGP
jgi:hypothetical protein